MSSAVSLNLKLIVLTLVLVFLDSRGWVQPFKNGLLRLALPFEVVFSGLKTSAETEAQFWLNLLQLREENVRLRREWEDLSAEVLELKGVREENALLKEQFKVHQLKSEAKLVLAEIVGRDEGQEMAVLVNQGENSGVRVGHLVIYKSFIFGKVVGVSASAARVRRLTDPESFFDGTDVDSQRAQGEVRGNFQTALRMEKILPTERINVGDTIVESSSGLILGQVRRVDEETSGILRSADLTVPFEIDKIVKVFIQLD